jgi:hypothetical protein
VSTITFGASNPSTSFSWTPTFSRNSAAFKSPFIAAGPYVRRSALSSATRSATHVSPLALRRRAHSARIAAIHGALEVIKQVRQELTMSSRRSPRAA